MVTRAARRRPIDLGRDLIDQLSPGHGMVIMAHPDDCEFAAGGTVALLCKRGWAVDIVVATSGNKGTKDAEVTAQYLAGTREQEQRRAAQILGANEPVFFGFPDGGLVDDDELRGLIVRELRRRRPELVITWDGFRAGTNHRDHRRIGRAVYDAIYPAADDHLYYPLDKEEGLVPHRPAAMLFAGADQPDYHVDIGPVLRKKVRAVLAHGSQIGARTEAELLRQWRERARAQGAPGDGGPRYRESFRRQILRR
ncbi:MAG: PIG-L family deacetylase [Dehalococcoidia bacterium]|nr:PIG-L family deacetylase [Dehalococcoidia bacterium]